jgi:hypothetical protein
LAVSSPVFSQNVLHLLEDQKMPKASIEQVSWISGEWAAEIWGGKAREIWMVPDAGYMTGAFQFIQNDSVQFLELISISEEKGSIVMRVRHFGADMVAWEDKAASQIFELVYLEPNRAYFNGITYILRSPEHMDVYVEIHQQDGTISEEKFAFKRIN